jgi:phosphoglycolate phosphatase
MRFRGVIFDLDGTLLDSLADIASSMNEVLAGLSFPPHPLSDYRSFVGEGMETLACRVLPAASRDDAMVRECVRMMRDIYARRWHETTRPYDGILPLLKGLGELGIPMAVLSNKGHRFTVDMVERLIGTRMFELVIGAGDEFPRKPDPGAARFIARHLGLSRENIIFVGDTPIDMHTARNAGMFPGGVLWGFRPAEELVAAGAERLFAAPEEILRFIT